MTPRARDCHHREARTGVRIRSRHVCKVRSVFSRRIVWRGERDSGLRPRAYGIDRRNDHNTVRVPDGRALNMTALTKLKIVAFAGNPKSHRQVATAVKPGFFESMRTPNRRSCSNTSSIGSPCAPEPVLLLLDSAEFDERLAPRLL